MGHVLPSPQKIECDLHFIKSYSLLHVGDPEGALIACKRAIDLGDSRHQTLELCLCCMIERVVAMDERCDDEVSGALDEAMRLAIRMDTEHSSGKNCAGKVLLLFSISSSIDRLISTALQL